MKKQTRLEKNYDVGVNIDIGVLDVACPTCGKATGRYCKTKGGNTAYEPHAARRKAVPVKSSLSKEKMYAEINKGLEKIRESVSEPLTDDPELARLKFREGQVNKLLMKVKRRDRVINRLVAKLRDHYTDTYILWELFMDERSEEEE